MILNPARSEDHKHVANPKKLQKEKEKDKIAKKKQERLLRKAEIEQKEAVEREIRLKETKERKEAREAKARQDAQERREAKEQQEAKERQKANKGKKQNKPNQDNLRFPEKDYTDFELEQEWICCLHEHKDNINKTFRILSLKYHPDKNTTQIKWAQEKQKKLGLIKEFYTKRTF